MPASIIPIGPPTASRLGAKTGLPNLPVLLGAKEHSILILRDYSSNVKRMLQVLEQMEQQ
jgi:hypothetical protein